METVGERKRENSREREEGRRFDESSSEYMEEFNKIPDERPNSEIKFIHIRGCMRN